MRFLWIFLKKEVEKNYSNKKKSWNRFKIILLPCRLMVKISMISTLWRWPRPPGSSRLFYGIPRRHHRIGKVADTQASILGVLWGEEGEREGASFTSQGFVGVRRSGSTVSYIRVNYLDDINIGALAFRSLRVKRVLSLPPLPPPLCVLYIAVRRDEISRNLFRKVSSRMPWRILFRFKIVLSRMDPLFAINGRRWGLVSKFDVKRFEKSWKNRGISNPRANSRVIESN